MVQHLRRVCESGELGEILIAQGTYSQDWLLYDTDWNWRVEAKDAGNLRAMGDIGSHWCDLVEHVTGLRITSLCADLATFHKTRKQPLGSVETFAGKTQAADCDPRDCRRHRGLWRCAVPHSGRARGAFTVSQVSAGRKNRLSIELYGTKAAAAWNQERPDELWLGRRDAAKRRTAERSCADGPGSAYADLPGGHSEGYDDTFKQLFRRFYQSVLDPAMAPEYPQFVDGLRQMHVLDAVRASNERRAWVDVLR